MPPPKAPLLAERRWTADDLDELPDDDVRYECLDGHLLPMTPVTTWHQRVAKRLLLQLDPQLPAGWDLLWECGVRLGTDWRIPDLIVLPDDIVRGQRLVDSAGTPLVIEVASSSTERTDRIVKPAEYADAGIPFYWRVETEPEVRLHAYSLEGTRYGDPVVVNGGSATPPAPFRLVVDVDALSR